jgi:hypothetical protein
VVTALTLHALASCVLGHDRMISLGLVGPLAMGSGGTHHAPSLGNGSGSPDGRVRLFSSSQSVFLSPLIPTLMALARIRGRNRGAGPARCAMSPIASHQRALPAPAAAADLCRRRLCLTRQRGHAAADGGRGQCDQWATVLIAGIIVPQAIVADLALGRAMAQSWGRRPCCCWHLAHWRSAVSCLRRDRSLSLVAVQVFDESPRPCSA